MAAILVQRSGPDQDKKYKLAQDVIRIGRKADNDIVLSGNTVSGHHAEIHRKSQSYLLRDLDSTNGTIVNGERIREKRLQNGDQIEVGENGPILEFRDESSRSSPGPRIMPVSGAWENGNDPIDLQHGEIRLGRGSRNDIVVGKTHGSVVSSEHATIHIHTDYCELQDLDSANGTFVNDHRISHAKLRDGDVIELGQGGPVFRFEWRAQSGEDRHGQGKEEERMYRKLERAAKGGAVGDRTMMIYQLATKYHKRRRRPYLIISTIVLLIAVAALTGVYYLWRQVDRLNTLNKFYQARSLQIELVGKTNLTDAEKKGLRARRAVLEDEYEKYLVKVGWYANKTPQEREVMRLARRLGEADLEIPPGFYQTVMEWVQDYKTTNRLRAALTRARERKLIPMIGNFLREKDLPMEFLFIALRESAFNKDSVGPETRLGYAKGMWQFVPPTATEYRLALGPLVNEPKPDPFDQRQDELRSTIAAAEYLANLYSTRAAASGLLVIASYNYGATRILKKLDELPNNPRERNFWNFYRNGWIPDETRKYVFAIFSAALICETPDLFGFDMTPISKEW
jgi:membrane-bound lytic murein transglycosylase D